MSKTINFKMPVRTKYMLTLEKENYKDIKNRKEEEYRRRLGKVYFTGNKTVFDEEANDEFLEV